MPFTILGRPGLNILYPGLSSRILQSSIPDDDEQCQEISKSMQMIYNNEFVKKVELVKQIGTWKHDLKELELAFKELT